MTTWNKIIYIHSFYTLNCFICTVTLLSLVHFIFTAGSFKVGLWTQYKFRNKNLTKYLIPFISCEIHSCYLHGGKFKVSFQTATSTCHCMQAGVAQGGIISVTKVTTCAIWQFTSKVDTYTLNFKPSPLVNTVTWPSHAKNHSDSSMTTSWIHWTWWLQNNVSGLCYCSGCSLWETKYPTCESLPQKHGVTTIWPHFLVQPNTIFHCLLCC